MSSERSAFRAAPDRRADQGWNCRRPCEGQASGTPTLDADKIAAALSLVKAGLSPTAAAKQLGLGRSTVYREVNRAGIERYPAEARSLETAVGFASGELDA
jgi:DNA invertase Pin-like site-specific DNA recombinase